MMFISCRLFVLSHDQIQCESSHPESHSRHNMCLTEVLLRLQYVMWMLPGPSKLMNANPMRHRYT